MADTPETEIERLKAENERLSRAITEAARWLQGPLRADTLNNAIRELNRALDPQCRIAEVAWGVASLGELQAAVRGLCNIVALPGYAALLTTGDEPMQRQRPGGFPV